MRWLIPAHVLIVCVFKRLSQGVVENITEIMLIFLLLRIHEGNDKSFYPKCYSK